MSRTDSSQSLTHELVTRGLLANDAPALPDAAPARPWFISIVLGVAGWLAGVFILLFVGSLFRPQSAFATSLIGAALLGAAFGLYAADRESAFFDQLALALSIAGQLALVWATYTATDSAAQTAGWMTLLQGALVIVLPNRLAKTLAALFTCIGWGLTVRLSILGAPSYRPDHALSLGPSLAVWTAIWAPLAVAASKLIAHEARWMATHARSIVRPALTGVLVSLAVGPFAVDPFGGLASTQHSSGFNAFALWPLLSGALALFAAFSAFRLRNLGLLGMALLGVLWRIGEFYYALGVSLLVKSLIMIAGGVLLWVLATWLTRRTQPSTPIP